MDEQPIALAGARLAARASGALWWAEAGLLCVADLHLGKSERLARRGGALLPPYETAETLVRLAAEVERLAPATVVCLGDSFDDSAAEDALDAAARATLVHLMTGRRWIWVAGNHDPRTPGLASAETALATTTARVGPFAFRHRATEVPDGAPDDPPGTVEISGHYHPKLRLPVPTRSVSRPCFLYDARRIVLPAFGAYTGGLHADSPALARLFGPGARAVVTGDPCVTLPLAPRPTPRRTARVSY